MNKGLMLLPLIYSLTLAIHVVYTSAYFKSSLLRLCPGVPADRRNNHCTLFFTNLWLAVEHCWVFCIGSCGPVHEDRTLTDVYG